MEILTIDRAGKMYFPKAVRHKIKERNYVAVILPDGTIMLHKFRRIRDPKKALKEFQKLPEVTKTIKQIKKEIYDEALKGVK
ncbi:MAG: AbrB family transcriptional regulator [Candidatus Aenigmarchaeota archaeon]|nr:AbrB family transcriptional regulator [Candidatus Aenigmarchaeota archaeon]